MIKLLLARFGKPAAAPPAAPAARKSPTTGPDFRGVTITSAGTCCAAARNAAGARLLMRCAPSLPLPDCSMPSACHCKFKRLPDRRDSDRRLLGGAAMTRWYGGTEHRQQHGRRRLDLRMF